MQIPLKQYGCELSREPSYCPPYQFFKFAYPLKQAHRTNKKGHLKTFVMIPILCHKPKAECILLERNKSLLSKNENENIKS